MNNANWSNSLRINAVTEINAIQKSLRTVIQNWRASKAEKINCKRVLKMIKEKRIYPELFEYY